MLVTHATYGNKVELISCKYSDGSTAFHRSNTSTNFAYLVLYYKDMMWTDEGWYLWLDYLYKNDRQKYSEMIWHLDIFSKKQ